MDTNQLNEALLQTKAQLDQTRRYLVDLIDMILNDDREAMEWLKQRIKENR